MHIFDKSWLVYGSWDCGDDELYQDRQIKTPAIDLIDQVKQMEETQKKMGKGGKKRRGADDESDADDDKVLKRKKKFCSFNDKLNRIFSHEHTDNLEKLTLWDKMVSPLSR
jgi:hypothetical protein